MMVLSGVITIPITQVVLFKCNFSLKEYSVFLKVANSRSQAGNVQDRTSIQTRTQGNYQRTGVT